MREMSKLEMWMNFLSRHDEETLKYAIEHNEYIKEAEEQYQEILSDPEVLEECIIHELENYNGAYSKVKSVYLIADTHFNHENIIDYCNRPFKIVKEMNDYIISKWNSVVKENDLVVHLGDFGFGGKECLGEINKKLNGIKILVKGNHDYCISDNTWQEIGFMAVRDKDLVLNNFVFSHFPLEVPKECYNIFGHIHNKPLDKKFSKSNHICVSCEIVDYTPVRLKDILKMKN